MLYISIDFFQDFALFFYVEFNSFMCFLCKYVRFLLYFIWRYQKNIRDYVSGKVEHSEHFLRGSYPSYLIIHLTSCAIHFNGISLSVLCRADGDRVFPVLGHFFDRVWYSSVCVTGNMPYLFKFIFIVVDCPHF